MRDTAPDDGYSDWATRPLPEGPWTMRTGKQIGRNLYIEWPDGRNEPVGQVDNAALAAYIVSAVNKDRTSGDGEPVDHINLTNL